MNLPKSHLNVSTDQPDSILNQMKSLEECASSLESMLETFTAKLDPILGPKDQEAKAPALPNVVPGRLLDRLSSVNLQLRRLCEDFGELHNRIQL